MCRLFGFRSVIPSQVHRSLVAADNALAVQSRAHPDGWGVAHYIDGAPHVTKSASGAMDCALFRRVSGIVASETVLAHIRRATQGPLSVLNSHPFQHGRWVFAHNGDIPDFARCREALEGEIAPRLRRFILGETDSERLFFLFLSELSRRVAPRGLSEDLPLEDVIAALRATVDTARRIADPAGPSPALLTLLVTNGQSMVAHQGGRELYYSTWKRRCADRDTCPSLSRSCEAPTQPGEASAVNGAGARVNHLVIASEPLQGENVWTALAPGQIVAVDSRMHLVTA